jgi:hypothetical protein
MGIYYAICAAEFWTLTLKYRSFLGLFLNFIFTSCSALGGWESISLLSDTQKPFFYQLKWEFREYNKNIPSEFFLRPALAYKYTANKTLWLGYDFVQAYHNSNNHSEIIWQALDLNTVKTKSTSLDFRTRFEERFIADQSTAFRLRERGTLLIKDIFSNGITSRFYAEYFFNLNHPDWVSSQTISQRRLSAGFEYPIYHKVNAQVAYIFRTFYNNLDSFSENIIALDFIVEMA